MEWWGLVAGVAIGVAMATLMAWRGREALRRRQAEEIQDAASLGWTRLPRSRDGDEDGDRDDRNENGS